MIYVLTGLVAACIVLGALWRLSAAQRDNARGERDQLTKDVAAEKKRTGQAEADAEQARHQACELAAALEQHQATRRRISKRESIVREKAATAAGKLEPDDDTAAAAAAAINRARGRT